MSVSVADCLKDCVIAEAKARTGSDNPYTQCRDLVEKLSDAELLVYLIQVS